MQESGQYIISENLTTTELSIIVPVFNAENNVCDFLGRLEEIVSLLSLSYEIIVVNDGSTDNTLQILQKEQQINPRIRILTYFPNRGKGNAVKMGVLDSTGELTMFVDGDLDISPATIVDYINRVRNCDLVIASKSHPLSRIHAPQSRKILSKAFNLIVRVATGISMRDTQSGLKVAKGVALRKIFRGMLVERYAFDVELLTIAKVLKLDVKELPVDITLNRRFKVKDILNMLVDVISISYRLRINGWYQNQMNLELERV